MLLSSSRSKGRMLGLKVEPDSGTDKVAGSLPYVEG